MATFGPYEADRPLYRTNFSTVYLLRSAEEGGRQRVIKAQKPSMGMHDETLEATQSRVFLDSAAVQQKVARFGTKSWAPIHEFGTASSGPFYVTDRYDFSLQWLIDGHVKLGAAGIHNIVGSIVQGLLALRQACQRPHGNLKSTNILIAGPRDMSQATIVLCDPLPDCHVDPTAHAKADLRRLGEIIHQVVVHASVPQITGYQVPDSEHWRKLGKQGEAWRHLCNRLLQANVESASITLEDLAAQLAVLAPRRSRRRLLMAPIAVLVISCVVVARLSCSDSHPPVSVEEARSAYDRCNSAKDWLGPLYERLVQDLDKINKRRYVDHPWIQNDPNLKELNRIEQYAGVFAQKDLKSKDDLPNDSRLRNDVADANEARAQIEDLLFHPQTQGYWPWLKQLGQYAAKFRDIGCGDMNDFLTKHVIPDSRDAALADHIDCALALKQHRAELEQCSQHIDRKTLVLEAVRDDPRLHGSITSTDVDEFVRRLRLLPDHRSLDSGDRTEEVLKALADTVEKLRKLVQNPAIKGKDRTIEGDVADLASDVQTIQLLPPTRGNRRKVPALEQRMSEIKRRIEQPKDWLSRIRGEVAGGMGTSQVIKDRCQSYLDSIGRTYGLDSSDRTPDWTEELWSVRSNVELTLENFVNLDRKLARTLETKSISKPWSEALRQHYENVKRRAIIGEITQNASGKDPFPAPGKYPPAWNDLLNWPARAAELVQDFSRIEAALNDCYMPEEPLQYVDANRGSIDSTYERWDEKNKKGDGKYVALLKEAQKVVGEELAAIDQTVQEIKSTQSVEDTNALLRKAEDRNLPLVVRCAAWRQLGQIPGAKERLLEELRREPNVCPVKVDEITAANLVSFQDWPRSVLAQIVKAGGWPIQYDLGEFKDDRPQYFRDPSPFRPLDLQQWQSDLSKYKRIHDPRDPSKREWKQVDASLKLTENLAKLHTDAEKAGKKEQLQKWEQLQTCCDNLRVRFGTVWDPNVSAIERDKTRMGDWSLILADVASARVKPEELVRGLLTPTWNEQKDKISLPVLAEMVQRCIAPAYCTWVDLVDKRVVFRPEAGLDRFEPLLAGEFSPPSSLSEFDEEKNRDLRKSFFERTEGDPETNANVGWPRYIRARPDQDSTVVLRFVPQEKPTDPPPFYMAIREITNEQYAKFLDVNKPSDTGRLLDTGWRASNPSPTMNPYRRAIDPKTHKVDPEERKSHPAVWVTYEGAKRYAKWLHAELPESSWHQRAVVYCGRGLPDPTWYHIRGQAWEAAVRDYNDTCTDPTKRKYAPLGAMGTREFPGFKEWDKLRYVHQGPPLPPSTYTDAWPKPSQPRKGLEILDLIGNVWEWSRDSDNANQPCICGGSCLSPLNNAAAKSETFTGASWDVGFRIAVPCPKAGRSEDKPTGPVRIAR